MSDRPTEGALGRPLGIDVDPLMIAGGLGEGVDALLGDFQPVAVAEVLSGLGERPAL